MNDYGLYIVVGVLPIPGLKTTKKQLQVAYFGESRTEAERKIDEAEGKSPGLVMGIDLINRNPMYPRKQHRYRKQ